MVHPCNKEDLLMTSLRREMVHQESTMIDLEGDKGITMNLLETEITTEEEAAVTSTQSVVAPLEEEELPGNSTLMALQEVLGVVKEALILIDLASVRVSEEIVEA